MKQKEKKRQKYGNESDYRLAIMPRETTIDVEGERSSKENGGNAQPCRERLKCPIPCFSHHPHHKLLAMGKKSPNSLTS